MTREGLDRSLNGKNDYEHAGAPGHCMLKIVIFAYSAINSSGVLPVRD